MEKETHFYFKKLALVDDGDKDLCKMRDGDCSKKDDGQNVSIYYIDNMCYVWA